MFGLKSLLHTVQNRLYTPISKSNRKKQRDKRLGTHKRRRKGIPELRQDVESLKQVKHIIIKNDSVDQ